MDKKQTRMPRLKQERLKIENAMDLIYCIGLINWAKMKQARRRISTWTPQTRNQNNDGPQTAYRAVLLDFWEHYGLHSQMGLPIC